MRDVPDYVQLPLDLPIPPQRGGQPEHAPTEANQTASGLPAHASEAVGPPPTQPNGGGTVLLVDDEEMVRDLARRMLEHLGFQALMAGDGHEALAVFRAHQDEVVCVLLDLTMPRMDGAQTLRELRKAKADLPVIVSSGYDEAELDKRLAGAGPFEFVLKPYEMAALGRKLKDVLGHAG